MNETNRERVEGSEPPETQRVLFTGLAGLPGQLDLFATDYHELDQTESEPCQTPDTKTC